jgi:Flp pilus assembly protein TadD
VNLGNARVEWGDLRAGLEVLLRARRAGETRGEQPSPALLNNLGMAELRLGRRAEAAALFREALALLPPGQTLRETLAANLASCGHTVLHS